jgi:hypothetical protein
MEKYLNQYRFNAFNMGGLPAELKVLSDFLMNIMIFLHLCMDRFKSTFGRKAGYIRHIGIG